MEGSQNKLKCQDCLREGSHCICDAYGALAVVYGPPGQAMAVRELDDKLRRARRSESEHGPLPPSADCLEIAGLRGALDGALASRDRAWERVKKLENRLRVIREALDGEFDG